MLLLCWVSCRVWLHGSLHVERFLVQRVELQKFIDTTTKFSGGRRRNQGCLSVYFVDLRNRTSFFLVHCLGWNFYIYLNWTGAPPDSSCHWSAGPTQKKASASGRDQTFARPCVCCQIKPPPTQSVIYVHRNAKQVSKLMSHCHFLTANIKCKCQRELLMPVMITRW